MCAGAIGGRGEVPEELSSASVVLLWREIEQNVNGICLCGLLSKNLTRDGKRYWLTMN